jgi:hypothetical protein
MNLGTGGVVDQSILVCWPGLCQRPHGHLLFLLRAAELFVVGVQLVDVLLAWSDSRLCATLTLRDASGT